MAAWNDELQDDRETWEDDPLVCSMVSEVHEIFKLAHLVPIRMQQKEEEEREKQRHFEENLARKVSTTREEEMRLQSAHFQTSEEGAPPSPKYVIPSFRKPPLSQELVIHEPESTKEKKEETTKPKEIQSPYVKSFPLLLRKKEKIKRLFLPLRNRSWIWRSYQ